jgi:PncC family amidohydrolase
MKENLIQLSSRVGQILTDQKLTIATAESCTGGLLSHTLTNVSGSSQYFIGGVVAYSNRIKTNFLGVESTTLLQHGAVSEKSAEEMARGIRNKFHTDIGLSTTGIAGPTGGTPTKPVGLVWLGISSAVKTIAFECHFEGGRNAVKLSAVEKSLARLLEELALMQ